MASKTDIYNMALALIGDRRIELPTDSNVRARTCTTFYEAARKEVLEAHTWKRAQDQVQIAADATDPSFGYPLRYPLPPDFINVVSIGVDLAWEVRKDHIHTHASAPLDLLYVFDLTDISKFSAKMIEAFSHKLAARISKKLTEDKRVATEQNAMFDKVIAEAAKKDGRGRSLTAVKPGTWHNARLRSVRFLRGTIPDSLLTPR